MTPNDADSVARAVQRRRRDTPEALARHLEWLSPVMRTKHEDHACLHGLRVSGLQEPTLRAFLPRASGAASNHRREGNRRGEDMVSSAW